MTKVTKIVDFIHECFDLLGLDIREYFYYDFDEGNLEEISWCNEDGSINTNAVEYASELLGTTSKDIVSLNNQVFSKWWDKYPYFKYIKEYEYAYKRTFFSDSFDKIRLFETLFNTKYEGGYPTRYDVSNIQVRLEKELLEIDKSLPGTYHHGAEITDIKVAAANFCEFEHITEMTESFIAMVERAKELFLKVVFSDLNNDEIQEYNMLVSSLGIRDKYYPRGYLRYNELVKAKDQYKHITPLTFCNEIVMMHSLNFAPWKCKNFIENYDLVKKYLQVVPEAKGHMREFAVAVSQFLCNFTWSDSKSCELSSDEDTESACIDELDNHESFSHKSHSKERMEFYVKKNNDELAGDDKASELLLKYCLPERLGGIPVKMPVFNLDTQYSFHRLINLAGKVLDNNYIERCVYLSEHSGGCDNE